MKLLSALLFITFSFSVAHSQVAQYGFNNNITDALNSHNAIYIENGVPSTNTPNYLNTSNATEILLDSIQGVQFPTSLINEIDTTASMEIEFTFTLTDLGFGNGTKELWSCAAGANEPGFFLTIRHDEFSPDEDYEIVLLFSDGGLNQEIPNHIGHLEAVVGYYFVGDVVDVRLILDFENNNWTSLVNGTYNSAPFDAEFDFNLSQMKAALVENNWYFGWHEGQDFDMEFESTNWSSTLSLDNFTVYSPRQPADVNLVLTALQAMTAHADGSNSLTLPQRELYLSDILLNYFNNHQAVATEVFDFIDAYENNYPPVYEDRNPMAYVSFTPEARLLIFLQQSVFDEQYTLANVESFEGRIYEFANIFPGPVAENAIRVSNAVTSVKGTHSYDPAARVVDDLADAKRPLGYYAPPGEIVTIEIPENMVTEGLSIMIGAHDADVSSLTEVNRFHRISKSYPLTTTSTDIISPFGGGLYLKIPIFTISDWFDVTISGAVKSPYFSLLDGHETAPAIWAAELNEHTVEWVDLESERHMMTLPLAHVETLTDPTNLMTQWREIMQGYRYVGGRPFVRPRSEYFLIDSGLPDVAFGTGYPQIIGEAGAPFGPFDISALYPTQVLNPDFWDSGLYITFHEMGHAVLHPTLIDETESIVHIPATYIYNQLYGLSIDEAFKYSSGEKLLLNEAAMDWMIAFNFRNNNDMGCDPTMEDFVCAELRYQHRGYAKYVNMAKRFGWETMFNMNKVFYDNWTSNGTDNYNVEKDDVLRAASEANNVNMAPLFHFWGHAPSPELKADLDLLPSSPEIYTQLVDYYQIIPESQANFLVWRDLLLTAKDGVHADRINAAYDNYDSEDYAEQMRTQICNLIAIYFPDSPSCELINSSTNLVTTQDVILLHPNPTDGIFTVKGNLQNCQIQLLSKNGALQQIVAGQDTLTQVDIRHLPAGVYFVYVLNSDGLKISTQRIVKEGEN